LELTLPLPQLKEIIRSFLTITYRKCAGIVQLQAQCLFQSGNTANNKRVSVPWGQISKNQAKFIDPTYLPDGLILQEPSKMHLKEISKLCQFFLARQSLGQPVLRFKAILPQHDRARHLTPVNEDMPSAEEVFKLSSPKKGGSREEYATSE
jgi:hypothetical protein